MRGFVCSRTLLIRLFQGVKGDRVEPVRELDETPINPTELEGARIGPVCVGPSGVSEARTATGMRRPAIKRSMAGRLHIGRNLNCRAGGECGVRSFTE
jgi:hypothetical protein